MTRDAFLQAMLDRFTKFLRRTFEAAGRARRGRPPLTLEELEDRCLLTGPGMSWIPLGPSPQLDPYGINGVGGPAEAASGRVTALTFGTYQNQPALFAGTAGGGVWRSTDYSAATPHWTPLTDNIGNAIDPASGLGAGVIDTGALFASGSNLYDGTGEANSGDGRYGTGIAKSTNGGDAWALVTGSTSNPTAFYQHSISKIIKDPAGNLYAAVVPSDLTATDLGADANNLGIYESTDNGATWTKITGGTPAPASCPQEPWSPIWSTQAAETT
jgi:hypothetical protein